MQVFKAFLKVLKSKWLSSLIYVIVFLVIAIPLAKDKKAVEVFEVTSLKIAVFDKDDTPESRALIELIGKDNKIVEIEEDREKILDSLYSETIGYALIINKGYSEALASGDTEELFGSYHVHDSYSVVYMGQFLNEYVSSVRAYMAGGMELQEAVSSTGDVLAEKPEVKMLSDEEEGSGMPQFFGGYFRYLPYIVISAVVNTLCTVLLVMTKKDIRYRTDCSCLSPFSFTVQLYAGSILFVLAQWLVLMGAGVFLFGMYSGRQWLAVLNSFIFTLLVTSLTIFIASFTPSERVISLMTQILGLGMSFLCGIFVPLSILSDNVIAFSRFLPAYWYVKANELICKDVDFTRGGGMTADGGNLILYMGIELGFAATFAVLSILVRKLRYGRASAVNTAAGPAL
ncbi:MAG: ABC transporter permease [Ruminococcus sp.]|nr:ABC transporter permease [Ruminococcus sp.]